MTIDLLVKKIDRLSERLKKPEQIMNDFESGIEILWDPNEVIKQQIRALLVQRQRI